LCFGGIDKITDILLAALWLAAFSPVVVDLAEILERRVSQADVERR